MPLYAIKIRMDREPSETCYLTQGDSESQIRELYRKLLPQSGSIESITPIENVLSTTGRENKILIVQGGGKRYEIDADLIDKMKL